MSADIGMAAAQAKDRVSELEQVALAWKRKYGQVQGEAVELERLAISLYTAMMGLRNGDEGADMKVAEAEKLVLEEHVWLVQLTTPPLTEPLE